MHTILHFVVQFTMSALSTNWQAFKKKNTITNHIQLIEVSASRRTPCHLCPSSSAAGQQLTSSASSWRHAQFLAHCCHQLGPNISSTKHMNCTSVTYTAKTCCPAWAAATQYAPAPAYAVTALSARQWCGSLCSIHLPSLKSLLPKSSHYRDIADFWSRYNAVWWPWPLCSVFLSALGCCYFE